MLKYGLTFGDIPFFGDEAQRWPDADMHPNQTTDRNLRAQFSPENQLVDEVNRLIPLKYINEFVLPPNYPGRNLGAIAQQWQIGPEPQARSLRVGDWFYPTGASRWSVFRYLATSSQAKAMLQVTGGAKPATFVMQANPIAPNAAAPAQYELSTFMYMLPPRPLAEHGGQFDGLYLVTLVDERYYWQYNPVSLRVTKDTTWAQLITQLGNALSTTLVPPTIPTAYGQPEPDSQLWTNQESAATLLDAIAYNLGCVVVRAFDGTYSFQTPAASQALVSINRGLAQNVTRVAGGDIFNSGGQLLKAGSLLKSRNAVLPQSVTVTFPKYALDQDGLPPHFVNPRYRPQRPSCWYEQSYGDAYSVNVPLNSGGALFSGLSGTIPPSGGDILAGVEVASGYSHAIHTTSKALYSGEDVAGLTPLNNSGITALANQLAQDFYGAQVASALDEVYPGTFAWTPEGLHDIIWTYSLRSRGAFTRVVRSEWNQIVREMQHGTIPLSGATNTPKGVGGPSVAQSWRDSYVPGTTITTTLTTGLASGGGTAFFTSSDNFPTQNRWRGKVGNEIILFEGTSGGTSVDIAWRGIDGTIQIDHPGGALVQYLTPDVHYGVNLVTTEKMQWVFPQQQTSGGIAGVNFVPQTQTVRCLDAVGMAIAGATVYSGQVNGYDTTVAGMSPLEYVWLTERNSRAVISGRYYDGQFAGFSKAPYAPVYLISEYPTSGAGSSVASGGINISNLGYIDWQIFFVSGYVGTYYNPIETFSSGGSQSFYNYTQYYYSGTQNYSGTTVYHYYTQDNYYSGSVVNYYDKYTVNYNSGGTVNVYKDTWNYYDPTVNYSSGTFNYSGSTANYYFFQGNYYSGSSLNYNFVNFTYSGGTVNKNYVTENYNSGTTQNFYKTTQNWYSGSQQNYYGKTTIYASNSLLQFGISTDKTQTPGGNFNFPVLNQAGKPTWTPTAPNSYPSQWNVADKKLYLYDGAAWDGFAPSPLTTKGDLWGFDSADNRVPVGASGNVLTADPTNSLGVSWQAPAADNDSIISAPSDASVPLTLYGHSSGQTADLFAVYQASGVSKMVVVNHSGFFDGYAPDASGGKLIYQIEQGMSGKDTSTWKGLVTQKVADYNHQSGAMYIEGYGDGTNTWAYLTAPAGIVSGDPATVVPAGETTVFEDENTQPHWKFSDHDSVTLIRDVLELDFSQFNPASNSGQSIITMSGAYTLPARAVIVFTSIEVNPVWKLSSGTGSFSLYFRPEASAAGYNPFPTSFPIGDDTFINTSGFPFLTLCDTNNTGSPKQVCTDPRIESIVYDVQLSQVGVAQWLSQGHCKIKVHYVLV